VRDALRSSDGPPSLAVVNGRKVLTLFSRFPHLVYLRPLTLQVLFWRDKGSSLTTSQSCCQPGQSSRPCFSFDLSSHTALFFSATLSCWTSFSAFRLSPPFLLSMDGLRKCAHTSPLLRFWSGDITCQATRLPLFLSLY